MTNKQKQTLIKEIDRCVELYFWLSHTEVYWHWHLCSIFNNSLIHNSWKKFWKKINTDNHCSMSRYFNGEHTTEEAALLRLLIVEDFKQWIREL